jgi:hypothetical protein
MSCTAVLDSDEQMRISKGYTYIVKSNLMATSWKGERWEDKAVASLPRRPDSECCLRCPSHAGDYLVWLSTSWLTSLHLTCTLSLDLTILPIVQFFFLFSTFFCSFSVCIIFFPVFSPSDPTTLLDLALRTRLARCVIIPGKTAAEQGIIKCLVRIGFQVVCLVNRISDIRFWAFA